VLNAHHKINRLFHISNRNKNLSTNITTARVEYFGEDGAALEAMSRPQFEALRKLAAARVNKRYDFVVANWIDAFTLQYFIMFSEENEELGQFMLVRFKFPRTQTDPVYAGQKSYHHLILQSVNKTITSLLNLGGFELSNSAEESIAKIANKEAA